MIATWLVRLYPPTWRARYGAEFAELLGERPLGVRDGLDVVRGALDARLHPQVARATRPRRTATVADRLVALAAVIVGCLFTIWAGIIVVASPRWGAPSSAGNDLIAVSYGAAAAATLVAIGVLVSLAWRYGGDLGPIGMLGSILAAAGLIAIGSEAGTIGMVMLVLGTLLLAPGLTALVGWLVPAAMLGATILMAAAMFGFVSTGGQEVVWLSLLIAYGPSWMVLGLGIGRGRPAALRPIAVAA
jgi:hypothetical protein